MGGASQIVQHGSVKLTLWMIYVLSVLDAEAWALFRVHILVSDGLRTYADQVKIFTARYVTADRIAGRKVYDMRKWNGVWWYRISSAGTVAVPGTSNHEVQGTRGAWDLRDTGNDAGITVASSKRGKWFRKRAAQLGVIASGDGFGEGWHFDVLNIFQTPPSSGGGTPTPGKDDEMFPSILINKDDPNGTFYLYDLRTQRVIRPVTRDENTSLRKAEARGAAAYIEVGAAEFKRAGGK